ncbi:hypothetical protein TIFTF001_018012 [Ficus carica]|uniref:Uncharacterized protein n=1 Tax=Ficus carica TaxID=3494 RepID=A0AA88DJ52_FICCA|nr:hypothetical protein TIFTF001_018012 [Ficus carica]
MEGGPEGLDDDVCRHAHFSIGLSLVRSFVSRNSREAKAFRAEFVWTSKLVGRDVAKTKGWFGAQSLRPLSTSSTLSPP